MKPWRIYLAVGLGLLALGAALKIFPHLYWGLSYAIELAKLGVLLALLVRAFWPRSANLFYVQFIAAAVVSMLSDWAWLSQLHG
jgi:hypothetical protein